MRMAGGVNETGTCATRVRLRAGYHRGRFRLARLHAARVMELVSRLDARDPMLVACMLFVLRVAFGEHDA